MKDSLKVSGKLFTLSKLLHHPGAASNSACDDFVGMDQRLLINSNPSGRVLTSRASMPALSHQSLRPTQ